MDNQNTKPFRMARNEYFVLILVLMDNQNTKEKLFFVSLTVS